MRTGHPTELHPGELVVGDERAEHGAVLGVIDGCLIRRLHHADGSGGGLQTAVLEAFHLEVEAFAEPVCFTDQMFSAGTHQLSNAIS